MSGKAARILCTEKQQSVLQQIRCSTTAPQRLVQRVGIVLMALTGALNVDIAHQIGLARKQVGRWRRRWQQSFDALVAIECCETHAELRRAIEELLGDAPRSGSPGTFAAEQVTQILAVACEPPEQSGRPIDRWTHRELADEVVRRGIVSSISVSQVGRYLSQAKLQPHRSKYWLNTKEKDPELFQQQVQNVCQTYRAAPDLYFQENTHTVSVDEMPGIPSLVRVSAAAHVVAESDRDRVWDCGATCCATRELHVIGRLKAAFAGIPRLLQPNVCQTIPLDLHRTPAHRRDGQTTRDMEGKLASHRVLRQTSALAG